MFTVHSEENLNYSGICFIAIKTPCEYDYANLQYVHPLEPQLNNNNTN